MSPVSPQGRKVTCVAVGVLRQDGRVLLADRPSGKPYAGYWEFPGGKIEGGESVAAALERELHEELGIEIGPSRPWVTFEFDYPHAYVELQFRLVDRWRGEPQAREGQRLRFVDPAGQLPQPLLPAAVPALRWLRLPRVALVVSASGATRAARWAADFATAGGGEQQRIIVVDAERHGGGAEPPPPALRAAASAERALLLASGHGSWAVDGWDGGLVEVRSLPGMAWPPKGWRGVWVDTVQEVKEASDSGCDFALLRSENGAAALSGRAAALPLFVRGQLSAHPNRASVPHGHGHWFDLRGIGSPTL